MLGLLRMLMLLMLVLLLRIVLSPFDVNVWSEDLQVSIIAPIIGLIVLYVLEIRQDPNVDFGGGECIEGVVVACFGLIPYGLSLYAIMVTGMLAGWVSHITGHHW